MEMKSGTFFSELKRRNVYKVAVAYAIVGWLLIQIATQVFPFFEIPNWAVRLVVLAIMIGFPIALVIAWAFELTPEGLKRTEDVDHAAEKRGKSHAWIYVVAVGAVLSIGLFFLGRYSTGNNIAPRPSETGSSIPQKSIAVLPFENLSDDKANAYFADGVQEEILTKLATVADLKVISRTSTAKYKSKPEDLKTVSQQLGVAHVLEGSVQRAGDKVRVNVQLIDARADSQVWAKSYDGDAKDIFGVESEVSQQVADALRAKLSPSEAKTIAAAPTTDVVAYDLFLKGESEFRRAQSDLQRESFEQAIASYSRAIAHDPHFALATARLVECRMNLHWFIQPFPEPQLGEIRKDAESAITIAPDLAEAHAALGLFYYFGYRAYPEALAEFARATELQPNNSEALQNAGFVHRRQGMFRKALEELNKAFEQDPRNASLAGNLANTYNILRMHDDAVRMAKRALTINPHEVAGMAAWLNGILSGSGDIEEAQRVLATFPADTKLAPNRIAPDFALLIGYRAYTLVVARKFDAAVKLWDNSPDEDRQLAARIAIRVVANDPAGAQADAERARPLLERRLQEHPDETTSMTELAWVYLSQGRNADAVELARKAADTLPRSKDFLAGGGLLVGLAEIEARAGHAADAVAILRKELSSAGGGPVALTTLKLDPVWDPIRNDPQFQQLLTIKEYGGP